MWLYRFPQSRKADKQIILSHIQIGLQLKMHILIVDYRNIQPHEFYLQLLHQCTACAQSAQIYLTFMLICIPNQLYRLIQLLWIYDIRSRLNRSNNKGTQLLQYGIRCVCRHDFIQNHVWILIIEIGRQICRKREFEIGIALTAQLARKPDHGCLTNLRLQWKIL